jgi:hypothetical protein
MPGAGQSAVPSEADQEWQQLSGRLNPPLGGAVHSINSDHCCFPLIPESRPSPFRPRNSYCSLRRANC